MVDIRTIPLSLVVSLLMTLTLHTKASAQQYPAKPVTIVVGFAAGGLNDVLARMLAMRLTSALGQPVIVENKPGAAANIAADFVEKSKPDGYTLLLSSSTLAINPAVNPKMAIDPLRGFAPVARISTTKMLVMVNPAVKANTLQELIALAKASPGKLNYASSGPGGPSHLASELFKRSAKIDLTQVPYKGGGPSVTAVVAGEVEVLVDVMAIAMPMVTAGRLRALAITGAKRFPLLPNVPTVAEAGLPEFDAASWNGVLAPAKTPPAIVARLNAEIVKIMGTQEVKERLLEMGAEPETSTPSEFGMFLSGEISKWASVVKEAGITPE
jgi:tripartite-type tricarboxylate transporter receptor subunit TctC